MDKYTCANCLEEFEIAWTDEEASVEFQQNFPESDISTAAIGCDDCYAKMGFSDGE